MAKALRKQRRLAAALAVAALMLVFAASASATTVTFRAELPSQALVTLGSVTLPATPVASPGGAAGQTCPGNSIIGAISAATSGNWSGTWTDARGWSIDSVAGTTILPGDSRVWDVYVNENYSNDIPCFSSLNEGDRVLLFPRCKAGGTNCFKDGPLTIDTPSLIASPKGHPTIQVWQSSTYFDPTTGQGTTTRGGGAVLADVYTPVQHIQTDQYYGVANISLTDGGPNQVTVTKGDFVPGRIIICVTDGQDGYCGTTIPPHNDFNGLDFCTGSNGHDGYCETVDTTPPVAHIDSPKQGAALKVTSALKLLKGTVDRDPSQVTRVDIRLKRQLAVKVKKLVRKKKVKVRNKKTKKLQTKIKKIYKTVTVQRCYGWRTSISDWAVLKSCKADAPFFKADGDEIWSFEFLFALPKGAYTLDAKATDGKGNVDSTFEVGRNRISWKIS